MEGHRPGKSRWGRSTCSPPPAPAACRGSTAHPATSHATPPSCFPLPPPAGASAMGGAPASPELPPSLGLTTAGTAAAPTAAVEPAQLSVAPGQPAEFRCVVAGNPPPTLEWLGRCPPGMGGTPAPGLGTQLLGVTLGRVPTGTLPPRAVVHGGMLRFSAVEPTDEGHYACRARSSAGQHTARAFLHVQGKRRSHHRGLPCCPHCPHRPSPSPSCHHLHHLPSSLSLLLSPSSPSSSSSASSLSPPSSPSLLSSTSPPLS